MKLYVGNLPFSCTEDELRDLFAQHGEVVSANLIMDRETGRPRGFGFIEFSDPTQGKAAIDALHGTNFGGRDLTVNEARPRESRGGARRPHGWERARWRHQRRAGDGEEERRRDGTDSFLAARRAARV